MSYSSKLCSSIAAFIIIWLLISIFIFSYGLLGPSGCGKTTLLRCALGRIPIQSGLILILGKPPGAKGHNIPGKGVGYMPQVSIRTLFGRILYKDLAIYTGGGISCSVYNERNNVFFWSPLWNELEVGKGAVKIFETVS